MDYQTNMIQYIICDEYHVNIECYQNQIMLLINKIQYNMVNELVIMKYNSHGVYEINVVQL